MHVARMVVVFALLLPVASAQAATVSFDLSAAYNIDGVANPGDSTQSSLDGTYLFLTQSLANALNPSDPDGLPDDGFYEASGFQPDMQLGYGLNPDGNNVLQLGGGLPDSVSVDIADGAYTEIHIAMASGGGHTPMQLTLRYSDGTFSTHDSYVQVWTADFFSSVSRYEVYDLGDRIDLSLAGYDDVNDVAIFGYRYLADPTRTLTSFTIDATTESVRRLNIFGATGVEAAIEPSPMPEPASLLAVGLGAAALVARGRRG